jgi:hypothetical protein
MRNELRVRLHNFLFPIRDLFRKNEKPIRSALLKENVLTIAMSGNNFSRCGEHNDFLLTLKILGT